MSPTDRTELQYCIALTMVPAIGPITARKLIDKLGSARAVFNQRKEVLEKIEGIGPGISGSVNTSSLLGKAEKEMEFMDRHRIKALYIEDSEYPERLKECADAPILLYYRGTKGLHCRRSLSVVGTRRATSYGRDICRELIEGLAQLTEDLVIVSGLAYGIDVIAHRAALEAGIPTVAVLGHGLSTLYPWAHRDTARNISEQGALVTDFHSGMGPERNNFLRRNRIIAGLSAATLVIESAKTGGALITADMASSYHRDVLAVPGRAGDERSKGCNRMIRDNLAGLVESPQDVICSLNWQEKAQQANSQSPKEISVSKNEKQLLDLISKHNGIDPGLLCNHTGIPIQRVLSLLIEMELKQWISVEPGNHYHSRIDLT